MIPSKFTVANGNVTDVYQSGNSIVALDKVLKFPRGKVKPWTDELMQEQDSLIALRKADQKAFAADPDLKKRLKALDDLEYNFNRSQEMAATLNKAGIEDTVDGNNAIFEHLLEVGQNINSQNRVRYPSTISGPNGDVKVLSTWTVLPDEKAYLSSINLIPKF